MANCARVSSVCTFTTELCRALLAVSTVLARIGIAPVNHLARVKDHFFFAAKFLRIQWVLK